MTTATSSGAVLHYFGGWKTVAPIHRMSNSSHNEQRAFRVANRRVCTRVCVLSARVHERERKRSTRSERGAKSGEGENKESGFRSKQVVTNEKKSLQGTRCVGREPLEESRGQLDYFLGPLNTGHALMPPKLSARA